MKLLQAKIRHLKQISDSGWFRLGSNLTLLQGRQRDITATILKGLETLNPLYDIKTVNPFFDVPKAWKQGNGLRQVIPRKMTAAFGVFDSDPEQVKALSRIEETLIETDRIEVGRRLDNSRWVSFVELPASVRWSEIAQEMYYLWNSVVMDRAGAKTDDDCFFNSLRPSTRIKGKLAEQCKAWLLANRSRLSDSDAQLLDICLRKATLPERVKNGQTFILADLPLTIYLQPEMQLQEEYLLDQLQFSRDNRGPVTHLIAQINHQFNLNSEDEEGRIRFQEELAQTLSIPFLNRAEIMILVTPSGVTLTFEEQIYRSEFEKRKTLIWTVAALTHLHRHRFPILLLDRFDRGLSHHEQHKMMDYLEECSEVMQVLLVPDEIVGREKSTDALLHVTSDGVIGEKERI